MAKAGHWGLSLRRRCGRPMRRRVRITAKDGLCVGLLQVWGQATFDAENRLRRYVDRRSFFVSQLPVQAGSPWPMSGLPSWDTICVISSGGEFAHSPPFLIALWAGSHTVGALAHPVFQLRIQLVPIRQCPGPPGIVFASETGRFLRGWLYGEMQKFLSFRRGDENRPQRSGFRAAG